MIVKMMQDLDVFASSVQDAIPKTFNDYSSIGIERRNELYRVHDLACSIIESWDFPGKDLGLPRLSGKESTCNAGNKG